MRLASLFAVDSFAGGFVVQSFIAYWFRAHWQASLGTLGIVFFAAGLLQAASFMMATRIAARFGLLNTMVFTHLPSNMFLIAIPLAGSLPLAIGFLMARQILSQMDVPTRQAYIVELVDPDERTAAAAYTNTARYITRPIGPAIGVALQSVTLGLPFFIAGGLKSVYDLVLYAWFRKVPLGEEARQ
jgi:predicted MFS family arabinose efflux permease